MQSSRAERPEEIPATDAPAVADVLADAFADYPVMRYVLGDAYTPERLHRLITFFVMARALRGHAMLGVRPGHQGRGLARHLLDAVHVLSARDPGSAGVSLTTELAANLPFYEHFGYRRVGHARVAPTLETWGLFREADGRPR